MLTGSELAFIALYKDSYPRIYKFVHRRVDDRELAQELTADVFRIAWQKWDAVPETEVTWMLSVARNVIGNAYRGRDRQRELQKRLENPAAGMNTPDSDNFQVGSVLMALRDSDRDVLQMAYWDELTTSEIAAVLQCSQSAAKVRLHRARAAFRKLLPVLCEPINQKAGA